VLLLDEIEKAHPDLFNILLQVMDHGKLTDHNGKQVDFRNVILIMTTNAGASDLARHAIGFNRSKREGDDTEAINRLFTPEFRNRLDAVIAFGGLPPEIITKVVEKFIFQLEAQLADRGVTIELTEAATKWLAEKGYDERFGARPLARVIQEHIKKPLAEELLFGKLEHGGIVRISTTGEGEEQKLAFDYIPADPSKKPKSREEEEDDETLEEAGEALVGAATKKALPGPKPAKDAGRPSSAVPSVPRRKKDE
jgi:ATP-dependent Clp protease ATP-binding subunit ClpA